MRKPHTYWDEGITLVSSCTKCSPGCENCWALAMEQRFKPEFKGQVQFHPDRLVRFNTRKPKVFSIWNDLMHEDVPFIFIQSVYKDMEKYQQNTYLILTKRPKIMAHFIPDLINNLHRSNLPINSVWHGLTVCNQQEADEKIPIFMQVPGKKFLSLEPLLGPVDLNLTVQRGDESGDGAVYHNVLSGERWMRDGFEKDLDDGAHIDAVILGGETCAGARPMHPDWVRSVKNQCQSAGVPFFFKNWGYWIPVEELGTCRFEKNKTHSRILDMETHDALPWVKV